MIKRKEIVKDELLISRMLTKRISQKNIAKHLDISLSALEKRINRLKKQYKVETLGQLIEQYTCD